MIRGPILLPRRDAAASLISDGLIVSDASGRIEWIDEYSRFPNPHRDDVIRARGVIVPPFFDNHIHIPQHPIRGHFMDGVEANPPSGRLIAGLNRNVFPAESRCADRSYAETCVRGFLADTLAHGVIGGAAYMTVHPAAARTALELLPPTWSVGLVAMNQNCPGYLRVDESTFDEECNRLALDFGRRFIATDRFAVSTTSELRKRVVRAAREFDLRTQTHLNEQLAEKRFVEQTLYPGQTYTEVYRRDGLLEHACILAHCIWMSDAELDIVAETRSSIAHCPVSNTLLGSGIMPLDKLIDRGIDYAICTDVGASPTTSLLNEMAQYLQVHEGRSNRATPSEALYRTTIGAARMMRDDARDVGLDVGAPMSFVEIAFDRLYDDVDVFIADGLLGMTRSRSHGDELDRLATGAIDAGPALAALERSVRISASRVDARVQRVTLAGQTVWERNFK